MLFTAQLYILFWSQYSYEINNTLFEGYKTELNVDVIQILHCADSNDYIEPLSNCEFYFLWIGQRSHRENLYNKIIKPINIIRYNLVV